MFYIEQFQTDLTTKFLGRKIIYKSDIDSTNDEIWQSLNSGIAEGTLVFSDSQNNGRGRRKNKWYSVPNKSLTFSFLLKPDSNFKKLQTIPLIAGISIVKGINLATSIKVGLKWPNDIMFNQKKLGGILIETKSSQFGFDIVVGIGININERLNEIPKLLENRAISLSIISGKIYDRMYILSMILNEFENFYLHHSDNIIPTWEKYCIHQKTAITFNSANILYNGIFQGITDDGHAEILIDGEKKIFQAGVVSL